MRISVDPGDPGYVRDSCLYQVYLDGRQLKDCVTADEEKGIAICFRRPFWDGRKQITDHWEKETLRGKVEIAKLVKVSVQS